MPYLYVFGRKDSTVSVMGANIYPADVEGGLYADAALAARVRSFKLSIREAVPGETRPLVDVQLAGGEPDAALAAALTAAIERHLAATNRDYAEARGEYLALMTPLVVLHRTGAGPFADDALRIKHRYIGGQHRPAGVVSDAETSRGIVRPGGGTASR